MTTKGDGGPGVCIPLENGGFTLVSPCDQQRALQHRWRLGKNGYVYRVGTWKRGVQCLLHRILFDHPGPGKEVHHLNGCKTDNRRENLEVTNARDHQRHHHSHAVRERNLASRQYPLTGECPYCGATFTRHPDHRGRQVYCSKSCASKYHWQSKEPASVTP